MSFDAESILPPGARIKVIGIGGGGGNAVNTMIRSNLEGVEFVSANTDVQSLRFSLAPTKIQVGKELTKGLGAGADPDIGRDAALEDRHEIQELLADADMVFITAGMGGGTGTGGASIIAQIARELGALTVAVVTKPFTFEGKRRRKHAELGIARLRESVDTLITIPNQRLLQIATPDLSMIDAFKMADNVLVNAVRGISDIINIPGTVNVDFADVKTVMSSMGHALMGIGVATGPGRALEAARQAIMSPLLEDVDIEGATGILINITAGSSVTLMEVNEACSIIQEAAHEDANIIFGAVIDETMQDAIRVTVIATGFPMDGEESTAEPLIVAPKAQPIIQPYAQPFSSSRLTTPRPTPSYAAKPNFQREQPRTAPSFRHPVATEDLRQAAAPKEPVAPQPERNNPFSNIAIPTPGASVARDPVAVVTTPEIPQDISVTPQQMASSVHEPIQQSNSMNFSEAQELARWTMEETNDVDHGAHSPERFEGAWDAREIDEPLSLNLGASTPEAPTTSSRTVSESLFDACETDAALSLSGSDTVQGATSAPLESFFDPELNLVGDIDRKIDEALALADRLRKTPGAHIQSEEDGLDVPAFLRNGMKDFPLG